MVSVHNFARVVTGKSTGGSATVYLNIWIYFNLIGNNFLLPLIVLTFIFSKTAKRHPILINLCMTWIFSGVFSLLLFYKNQHVGSQPDRSLCIAQASLLFGITPMWSAAVLAMVYYMFHTLSGRPCLSKIWRGLPIVIVLSAPYIVLCSFSLAALMSALRNPDNVSRHTFFCGLNDHFLTLTTAFFTLVICVFVIILEVALAMILYRSWRTRQSSIELPIALIARMFVFGVYVLIGLIVDILYVFVSPLPGVIYATIAGTIVVLIFGTQGDVFRAWCFWRKNDEEKIDPIIESRQREPVLDIRSSTATSIRGIFMSPNSDQRPSSADRLTRLPDGLSSLRSSHRSSTKTFVRLRDENEIEEVYREVPKRSTMRLTGASTLGEDWNVIQPPKLSWRPRSNERQKNVQSQGHVDGKIRSKSVNERTRTRANPPRPKGPRKASGSVSSLTTPLVADGSIKKPAASLQPAKLSHTVSNSLGH